MPRRLWVSLGMVVVGVTLLVTAQIAGAVSGSSSFTKGGVFQVGTTGASVQVDPQLAYITTAWWLEYATAAKLYNYPDKRGAAGSILVPEAASKFTVSPDGRKYTFFIRKGFRLSDGTPVTAKNFKYAIDRVANHDLASPGAQFIIDAKGTNIVGAQEVNRGQGTHVRGAVAKGNRLIIRLTQPDGSFLSKITMPFFQATSTKLPLDREIVNIDDITTIPSAGPYAYSRNDVNQLTSLRQNPFWKRGPGRNRPRNLTGLDLQWNLNEQTAFHQVENNELDEGPLPAADVQRVADTFGVNKTRFWSKPVNCVGWMPLNNRRGIFKNNVPLRQAINWGIDRTDYATQAGPYAGFPLTHVLPPGSPGSINTRRLLPYGPRANIERARQLAAGHFGDGKIVVAYRSSGTIGPAQAQIVRRDLIRIGFAPENIDMRGVSGSWWMYPPDWDLVVSGGWCSDFPDPYNYFSPFFWPESLFYAYPSIDDPRYVRKIERAAELVGSARSKAFGKLDIEMTKKLAPLVAMRTYNNRYFFSDRVNPKSLVYQGIYQDWSIPALALK